MIRLLPAFLLFVALPAMAEVDFLKDVKPILQAECLECHRVGPKSDFTEGHTKLCLETREEAMKVPGVIVEGQPEKSSLYTRTIAADDAKELMPPRNPATGALLRLSKPDTEVLRQWIAEGAKWPASE